VGHRSVRRQDRVITWVLEEGAARRLLMFPTMRAVCAPVPHSGCCHIINTRYTTKQNTLLRISWRRTCCGSGAFLRLGGRASARYAGSSSRTIHHPCCGARTLYHVTPGTLVVANVQPTWRATKGSTRSNACRRVPSKASGSSG
jgi:hypothetical protein